MLSACGPGGPNTESNSSPEARDAEVEALTGAHTRVVWIRDIGDGDNTFGGKDDNLLMAYDSRDGRGERVVLEAPGNYFRPLITPDGERIVFTDIHEPAVYVVDWEGGLPVKVADGSAGALWMDPEDGRIWVYGKRVNPNQAAHIIRYPLDAPDEEETLWTRTDSTLGSPGSMQIARDGRTAAFLVPWPVSAVVEFSDKGWYSPARGCWPGIAPDNSYLSWTFDGSHRYLIMHDLRGDRTWRVRLADAPGVGGHEVYHPRWSNHPRFMTMTGPYNAGKGKNQLDAGGDGVDVHLGRFASTFEAVEDWVQLTRDDSHADFFPDVWIAGGAKYSSAFDPGADAPHPLEIEQPDLVAEWPGGTDGLVFLWTNNRIGGSLRGARTELPPARAEATGEARFGRHHEMHLRRGAIRFGEFNELIREQCVASNALTVELTFAATAAERAEFSPIVSFSNASGETAFTLGQEGDALFFLLETDDGEPAAFVRIGAISRGERHHVLVSYRDSMLTCYLDGRTAMNVTDIGGGLQGWPEDLELVFGNDATGQSPWSGYIEGVAIYNRFIGEEEAAWKARAYATKIEDRAEVAGWNAKLRLLEKAAPPSPQAIAPYERALVVNDYEVVECAENSALAGTTISIAEWALLDREVPAYYRRMKAGDVRELLIERFDDHPQLESERLVTDKDILDLELYYQVFPGA